MSRIEPASSRYTRSMHLIRTVVRILSGDQLVRAGVAGLAIASLFAMSACSGLSSLNPFSSSSANPVAGTWTGSVSSTFTTGTLQLVLTQSSSQVTGTWTLTFSNASQNDSGTVSGTVNGSSVSASLQPERRLDRVRRYCVGDAEWRHADDGDDCVGCVQRRVWQHTLSR